MSLTFFPQETRVSCTAACLRMVLAHWGIVCDEATLRECCKTSPSGTRAKDAVACARQYGLGAEELSGAKWDDVGAWLQAGLYPLALINLFPLKALWVKHAVVIEAVDPDLVSYLDPVYDRQKAPVAAFDQAWAMNRSRVILVKKSADAKPTVGRKDL